MRWLADWDHRVALALFALSLTVYAYTASPTISFWDCGEFVATAYTLGIPHQPATPLYVLVGRVFSLLPLPVPIAFKVNLLSTFFSALAISFMFLTAVRLQRLWATEREHPSPAWIARAGAATGALFLAFSTTFWNSAIEAEVYALSAFTLAFTAYLSVLWYEIRDHESSATLMLLIIYLMGMSIGFHMGSFLVYFGVFVLVLISDRKALSSADLILVSLVMFAFVMSTMKVWDWLVLTLVGICVLGAAWRTLTWGVKDEIPHNRWFAFAGMGLFVLGLSVHLFLLIRAYHDPLINQTDPTTFDRLMTVLRREQYPPRSPFEREAPLLWQFGHLWGTSVWREGQLAESQVVGYVQQFSFFDGPNFVDRFIPLALWLLGIYYQLRGNWRLGASFLTTLMINSIGLLVLLNFTWHEVRDRDYFYFGFYQFAALFLGLGVGGLLRSLWLSAQDAGRPPVLVKGAAVLLLLLPLLPVLLGPTLGHSKWFEHDRSRNWIARNYGRNILASLPPNAMICTNGDNDTFPLWYLQEVEGFRTDVRVINLSLINLPWYIKQLRDYEPQVPITWTDAQIDGEDWIVYRDWKTKLFAERMPDGSEAWIRDKTMWHIVRSNQWERPIYYAVTVPNENIGMFLPYLSMEGLVHRLTPERNEQDLPKVDSQKIWENFTQVYDFTSVLDAEGRADETIYRDAQTSHLLRNYPAALCRVGYTEAVQKNYDRSVEALEMAYGLEPGFPLIADMLPIVYLQAGQQARAIEFTREILDYHPVPAPFALDLGEALITIGERERAVEWAEGLTTRYPDEIDYAWLLVQSLLANDDELRANAVIDEWEQQTGDQLLRREYQLLLDERREQVDSLLGRPPPAQERP